MSRHQVPDPNAARRAERADRQQQQARPNAEGEIIVPLAGTPLEEIREEEGVSQSAEISPVYEKGVADGVKEELARREAEPDVVLTRKVYTVLADKNITSGGVRTQLRAGKVVDPSQYNIRDLRAQGVQLHEEEVPV